MNCELFLWESQKQNYLQVFQSLYVLKMMVLTIDCFKIIFTPMVCQHERDEYSSWDVDNASSSVTDREHVAAENQRKYVIIFGYLQ